MKPDVDRVACTVIRALAYAAGVTESDIGESTAMLDLGIDSVSIAAVGVILEAELGIRFTEPELIKLLEAKSVSQNIALIRSLV